MTPQPTTTCPFCGHTQSPRTSDRDQWVCESCGQLFVAVSDEPESQSDYEKLCDTVTASQKQAERLNEGIPFQKREKSGFEWFFSLRYSDWRACDRNSDALGRSPTCIDTKVPGYFGLRIAGKAFELLGVIAMILAALQFIASVITAFMALDTILHVSDLKFLVLLGYNAVVHTLITVAISFALIAVGQILQIVRDSALARYAQATPKDEPNP